MRNRLLVFGMLSIATLCLFPSCQRDDICAESTPTTPLLIIRFYDSQNPSEFKTARNLGILEDGETTGIAFNADSIAIPLRTNIDATTFRFVLNATGSDDDNPENSDLFTINYTRTEEYVSKACGFRVTYDSAQAFSQPLDDGSWIDAVEIQNATIDNETAAHIRIFH